MSNDPNPSSKWDKYTGLRRRRKNLTDKKPQHYCENCKCHRYSLCGCAKK